MKNIFIKSSLILTAIFALSGCTVSEYQYDSTANNSNYDNINIVDKPKENAPQATKEPAVIETTVPVSGATENVAEKPTNAPAVTEKVQVIENVPVITEAPVNIYDDFSSETYVEYYFRTEQQLNQHFTKHGGEFKGDFDYETAEEYEAGASDVINNPDALHKTEAEDGDGVYYIEGTNEFVVLSTDGYIRTYFRPNAGIEYYNRQ